jgi:hypothetical protein
MYTVREMQSATYSQPSGCLAIAARQLGSNYLVNITMTGPHAVSRMLPTAYGTV